jgi:hypothetical protein
MARPPKEGLDYFPLDVGIDQDDKLVVPIGKYGMQGYGIIIRLMSEIYKKSYFYPWSEKEQYVLANKVNVDINLINEIVNECTKWGFFNEKMLGNHQILTSRGFQIRYIEAAKRRKSITMIEQYSLVDLLKESQELTIFVNDVNGNEVNVYIKPIKVNAGNTVTTQSKVKESKVNKSKVNKDIKTSSRQPRTYAEDSTAFKMAIYLHHKIMTFAESISKDHLVRDADMQKWADSCRKILELDNRDRGELRDVIDWATADSFWQQNILSPDKLRSKFTELSLKMSASKKGSLQNSNERHLEKNKLEALKILEAEERERIRDQANLLENQQQV